MQRAGVSSWPTTARQPILVVLLSLFGGSLLSRADVGEWPVLGHLARHGATVFVDRSSGSSGATAIRAMRRRLAAGGTLIVFPEGTTVVGDEVRPFHAGAFAAARGLNVQILPVGLAYEPGVEYWNESFGEHMLRLLRRRRILGAVEIGASRPAAGSHKAADLARILHDDVQALVHLARARVGP